MKRRTTLLLILTASAALLALAVTLTPQPEPSPEPPSQPTGVWFPHQPTPLMAHQQQALNRLQQHLADTRHPNAPTVDYRYRLRSEEQDTVIFVEWIVTYRDGEPVGMPGGHAQYRFDPQLNLIDHIPGR